MIAEFGRLARRRARCGTSADSEPRDLGAQAKCADFAAAHVSDFAGARRAF
jgi:hypothetical protein